MKKLPGKVKIFKQYWGKEIRYGIRFYWPFQTVVTDYREIDNPWGDDKLYKKVPLLFETEEEAKRFIRNELLEHWNNLNKIEIVEGI